MNEYVKYVRLTSTPSMTRFNEKILSINIDEERRHNVIMIAVSVAISPVAKGFLVLPANSSRSESEISFITKPKAEEKIIKKIKGKMDPLILEVKKALITAGKV